MNPHYRTVASRASHRCEYCHAPEVVFNLHFEVEHIEPQTVSRSNEEANLALACRSCNLYKGVHLTGWDEVSQSYERLYHPRVDLWKDHFEIDNDQITIKGLTSVGRATIIQLRINREAQLLARLRWVKLGLFP